MFNLFQTVFFSACVSCGLAVLRNVKFNVLPYIFVSASAGSLTFNVINNMGYTFAAGLLAGIVAAICVGVFHRKGLHSYLFIMIPVIYCIGPGGALYKLFFTAFNGDWVAVNTNLVFILKDAIGIWFGILLGTELMNRMCKTKSEEF